MDEKEVLQYFCQSKILTINQIVELLQSSVITVRRRLKKWNAFTSINKNGRYYTLPQIPVFDKKGLWKYQSVLFSKHGNLKQTVIWLVCNSPAGLSVREIAKIVELSPSSSLFTQIKTASEICAERHHGRFLFFSGSAESYSKQQENRAMAYVSSSDKWPSDSDAVVILVQLIKHAEMNIQELAAKVKEQGRHVEPGIIRAFLAHHDLLKKTSV